MESYADYPSGVSNNAKRGIDLNEKNGNKCATQVEKSELNTSKEKSEHRDCKRMYTICQEPESIMMRVILPHVAQYPIRSGVVKVGLRCRI